ncbi:MAG: septation protein SepH [Pseudonocardiaceae bacterium]
MRALRVVGLHEDGKSIVCEDPARGERFQLPADDRLRAAARGDIARLGQIQIELESHMRPREIQARIRAGETVSQVASSAGIPEQRVERFAYPVLLERSRHAELAQHAHPVREDGPDVQTLGEVVVHAFGVRGQDYSQANWDSWRGDDGKWMVALRWKAGRSDNRAIWGFSPGAHGGTVTALDEHAQDILDPHTNRAPRTLRPLHSDADVPSGEQQPTLDSAAGADSGTGRTGTVIEARIPEPGDDDTTEIPKVPAAEDGDPNGARAKGKKKNHPVVPAWEDVLLGVRSQRM